MRTVAGIGIGCAVVIVLIAMANAVVFHGEVPPGPPVLPLLVLLFVMHGFAAFAGGYTAAAVAPRRPRTHGLAVGVAYVLVVQLAPAAFTAALRTRFEPPWFVATAMLIILVGTTLGAAARAQMRVG